MPETAYPLETTGPQGGGVPTNITQFGSQNVTLGQKTAAASIPVTIASDDRLGNPLFLDGTSVTPNGVYQVGGKSNDVTSVYRPIPLGTNGRSVIVEGFTGGTEIPINISKYGNTATTLGLKNSAASIPVVIASDNNVNTVSAQAPRMTGTITTNTSVVSAAVSQYSVATVDISGTYAGVTVNFEASTDGGTTWYGVLASDSTSTASASTSVALGTNASKLYNVTLPGITNFRVRASAYTSGTANVGITATADPMVFNAAVGVVGTASVQGPVLPGFTASGGVLRTGAVFNTTQTTVTNGQISDIQATARGAVIVATGVDAFTAQGGKTTNAAIPGATNIGTLPAVANAAKPTFTETFQTALSVDLAANLRMRINDAAGNDRGANVTSANAVLIDLSATTANATAIKVDNSAVNQPVVGNIANGSLDSGNPVKIGGVGKTANPSAVTDGQRVNALFDKLGKQVVVGAVRDLKGNQQTTITSSTSETTIITSVSSVFLDVYGIIVSNTSATACAVTVKDATAGTTRVIIEVPANDTRGFMLPVDSAMKQSAVTNNWTATCGTSVASISITALYVQNL